MAGIYIHIPFCKQACTYCNFHFSTSLKLREEMVVAIVKEMKPLTPKGEKVEDFSVVAKETIETIYFGGGTPSILLVNETILSLIYEKLLKYILGILITFKKSLTPFTFVKTTTTIG